MRRPGFRRDTWYATGCLKFVSDRGNPEVSWDASSSHHFAR
jgi:hypothetical protein